MATPAKARDTLYALRHKIASIEGRLAETLEVTDQNDGLGTVLRHGGQVMARHGLLPTGSVGLDAALGGGVPRAALTEIHGTETRKAASVAGFALGLLARLHAGTNGPILWIGTSEIFRESGFPYALGLKTMFGIEPHHLLFCETRLLSDALWVAEEASGLSAIPAILLEVRGNPARLDLTATRRLQRRAELSGRPILLLRQAAETEPTAAPIRFVVAPAEAGLRATIAGPLPRSIGPPRFEVTLSKSRTAVPGQFTLEWNPDERAFHDPQGGGETHAGAVVSVFGDRANSAAETRKIMAVAS